MISIEQYFGKYGKNHKDVTPARYANAQRLLGKVNKLMVEMMKRGIVFLDNPNTKCQVAGEMNGGFRPQDCPIGASNSAHKEGLAVDIYDPMGKIDEALNHDPELLEVIKDLDMYFEALPNTIGWSHWTIRKPPSGRRFFIP